MAKIVRSTQKIFGVNAAQNQITEFGSIKAGAPVYSQNVANIQTAAFEGGWSDALQDDYAPYRQDRNAVDLVTTSQLAYLFQEGVPEWDAGTVYYKGSLAKVTTSDISVQLYMSKVDNNTANYSNTDNWTKILDTANAYALSSEVVKLTGAQIVAGVKTFSDIPKISATIGSTDNTTQVPTTAWVNSRINNITNSKIISSSGTNYVKFGDGTIIQWGTSTSIDVSQTITFQTKMTTTTYAIIPQYAAGSAAANAGSVITNRTTTNFTVYWGSGAGSRQQGFMSWIVIGK